MLFPAAWLARQTRVTNILFDYITPEWVHIVGHTFLFAALAVMMLSMSGGSSRLAFTGTLLMALLVGVLQESIQMAAAGMRPGPGELFDIGVDLTGALCGIALVHLKRKINTLVRPVNRGVSHRQSRQF